MQHSKGRTVAIATALFSTTALVFSVSAQDLSQGNQGVESDVTLDDPTVRGGVEASFHRRGQSVYRADEAVFGQGVYAADASTALSRQLALSPSDSAAMAASLVETSRDVDSNTRELFANFNQSIDGLRVYGSYAKTVMSGSGQLLFSAQKLASPRALRGPQPRITPEAALRAALRANFAEANAPALSGADGAVTSFEKTDFFFSAPTAELVYYERSNALMQGYLVQAWSDADNMLYETLVDGAGDIVSNQLRTNNDRIRYYPVHPSAGGARTRTTPSQWTSGSQFQFGMQGPNAIAYLDRDANNSPDSVGATITNERFTVSANLSQSPTTTQNKRAAIQNMFYWNNQIHDYLEARGFSNAYGNFEGNDPVRAEAQDGSGVNNANFSTPSDGASPRMQMFIWNRSNPNRDADLDSDVIWHEYGHGVTWRMVGNMSGNVSGALGEGNSDVLAILYTGNDRVGEYSNNNSNGIRSSRYSQHRDTLGDFNASRGVHRNGEIYAATLWEMRRLYRNAGIRSRNTIIGDVIRGYRFTPSQPTYIEMRNGLLQATPSSRDCFVWRAFASKGMGVGATMSGSGATNESFSIPSGC